MSISIRITKEQALAAYDWRQVDLAKALGITPSAVSQWPPGQPIPGPQALKLYYQIKPEVFQLKPDVQPLAVGNFE